MMASENDQLLLGHAQIVKPLMKSEKMYFSKGSNLDNFNGDHFQFQQLFPY
jgi:hypothetical protein